ncbi:MAG: hypothetical protein PHH27_03375, partial [Candidatus Colwellbacteria bacterium]|nr:hypothetical protein [Candidatus Colwellbacteria bacterium]
VEKGCLGGINKKDYQENVERDLYSFYIKKINQDLDDYFNDYMDQNPDKDPYSFLLEIQKENPARLEELKRIQQRVKKIMDERVRSERLRFLGQIEIEDQFKIVEESQGEDFEPSEPKTKFAYDLHATIAEKLNLDNFEDLEYYTAVGTHLDNCGVDAFFKFKYQDEKGEEKFIRVCFDITINTPEGKRRQETEKRRAGETILTDLVLFLSHDEIETIKELYSNRNKKEEKNDVRFQKMRREYKFILNDFANKIINQYKKRR